MATRSLTEVFILMRNNVIQTKRIFADRGLYTSQHSGGVTYDDRTALVNVDMSENGDACLGRIPPEWVNMVEEVHYEMSRIDTKLRELAELQERHIGRPAFDDEGASKEERVIEDATREITNMLSHCQRLIQHILQSSEGKLSRNVTTALVQALQTATVRLRSSQAAYLRRIKNREENFSQYFEAFGPSDSMTSSSASALLSGGKYSTLDYERLEVEAFDNTAPGPNEPLTMRQLQKIEENSAVVEQREREILHVTRSIVELNQLFKDLAAFIVDQGSVVDRIDYNIEQSSIKVQSALKAVKKAESYQKNNRKMTAIVVLAAVIAFLVVMLIIVKHR